MTATCRCEEVRAVSGTIFLHLEQCPGDCLFNMHVSTLSRAFLLTTVTAGVAWASAKPVINPETFNKMPEKEWGEWTSNALQRHPSTPPETETGASAGQSTRLGRSRAKLRSAYANLKAGKLPKIGKKKPAPPQAEENEVQKQNTGLLRKYEGKVPETDYKLPEGRKYGSLAKKEPSRFIGIEARAKERKALKQQNTWNMANGLGAGLGFPNSNENALSRAEMNKMKASQRPKRTLFQSDDPQKEALWQRIHAKDGRAIASRRGDADLYHRHANVYVKNEPDLRSQSFVGRDHKNEPENKLPTYDSHHRLSMTSDGRYSGDGSFLGKSSLAMGAEGPPSKSLLAAGNPDYSPGQYRDRMRPTATEYDDVRSSQIKPHSRLDLMSQKRQGENQRARQRAQEDATQASGQKGKE